LDLTIPDHTDIAINLSFLDSSLLGSSDIPTGQYEKEKMRSTVVPFRNGIFLSYAISIAENDGFDAVAIGAHSGDHDLYPDCTIDFIESIDYAAHCGTYQKIRVIVPFKNNSKTDIVEYGYRIGIGHVMAKTYSCYNGQEEPCNTCATCIERNKAFDEAMLRRPT